MDVSWQARAFVLGMRAIRLKQRMFGDEAAIEKTIRRDRKKGPDRPSARLRRRFVVEDSVVDGRRVTTVAPRGKTPQRTVLYLHGGGFIMSMTSLHWLLVARLCHRLDAVVVVPDYPLAPEHSCLEINEWLVGYWKGFVRGHDPATTSIMGDSAGGHLALALALQARDRGVPLPSSLVLFSPAVTGDYEHELRKKLDLTDCMISLSGLTPLARMLARDLDPDDPRIALLKAKFTGLPPFAVFAGTHEVMHYDAERLAERAAEEGVDASVYAYAEMFHAFPIFPIPEARRAVKEVVDFVKKQETSTKTAATS